MRVEKLMDLGQLAELMGSETTEREAHFMRQFLMDDNYDDTDDVSGPKWLQMIEDAVELAEAEEGALPRLAREAAADGGPTHADLRGEVQLVADYDKWVEELASEIEWEPLRNFVLRLKPGADLRGEVQHG